MKALAARPESLLPATALCLLCFFARPATAQVLSPADSAAVVRSVDSLLGLAKKRAGESAGFGEAIEAVEAAQARAAAAFGENSALYAKCLHRRGSLYLNKGEFDQAEAFLLAALAVREKVLGRQSPDYAYTLWNLASLNIGFSRYEMAEKLQLEVLSILHGRDTDHAMGLCNLANIYIETARYEQAEPALLESLAILERAGQAETGQAALVLQNLANLHTDMGNFEKAEAFHLRGLALAEKTAGKESLAYAAALGDLARLYNNMGRFERAGELFEEARAIHEKASGKESPGYATFLNNLGMACHNTRQYERAKAFFGEALSIYEKSPGRESQEYARCLTNSANLQRDMGRPETAEPVLREALGLWEKLVGKAHPDYIRGLQCLAGANRELGRAAEAAALYREMAQRQAANLLKYLRYLSENELARYAARLEKDQARQFSLAAAMPSPGDGLAGDCYDNALFRKDFILDAVARRRKLAAADPDAARLDNDQRTIRRRLEKEYAKPAADRDPAQAAALEDEANGLEKELAQRVAGFGEIGQQVGWREVREKLRPGEAAIEFVHFRYHDRLETDSVIYAALVLGPGDDAPVYVPLFGEAQLRALTHRPQHGEENTIKDLYGNRHDFYRLFWRPLAGLLRGAKTVFYAPSGLLHAINPIALEDERGRPVTEGQQWVRLGSTRELVARRLADAPFALKSPAAGGGQPVALVIGGIRYDMDSLAFAADNPPETKKGRELPPGRPNPSTRWTRSCPAITRAAAPAAGRKTAGPRSRPPPWRPRQSARGCRPPVLRSSSATATKPARTGSKDRWPRPARGSPQVVHFATHGFAFPGPQRTDNAQALDRRDDPMLRSGLLLAGADFYWKNRRPLGHWDDGVLLAYEVQDMGLEGTELVVLSACQTGLGDAAGPEGVYGLQRAFRIAGARFLVVSLWQVPDAATQEMMSLFYENWAGRGESLRDAFGHAQGALRERLKNPYLWGGFVLVE